LLLLKEDSEQAEICGTSTVSLTFEQLTQLDIWFLSWKGRARKRERSDLPHANAMALDAPARFFPFCTVL
jgi:hypothetical protein